MSCEHVYYPCRNSTFFDKIPDLFIFKISCNRSRSSQFLLRTLSIDRVYSGTFLRTLNQYYSFCVAENWCHDFIGEKPLRSFKRRKSITKSLIRLLFYLLCKMDNSRFVYIYKLCLKILRVVGSRHSYEYDLVRCAIFYSTKSVPPPHLVDAL